MRKTAGYFRGYGLRSERRRQSFVHLGGRAGSQPRHWFCPGRTIKHREYFHLAKGIALMELVVSGKGFTMHWMWPTTSILPKWPKMMKMTFFLTAIFDSEGIRLATSAHRSSKRWSNTGEISPKMAFNVLTCLDLKDCLKLCLESKWNYHSVSQCHR